MRRSRWSWSVGEISGIPIRIHATMLLLLAWIAVSYSLAGLGPSATAAGIVLVVLVFAIVLIHELGHALMARRFGVRTREILLLPIGGIGSLERIPERAGQELAIALIGPAINVVLAAILGVVIAAAGWDPRLGFAPALGPALVVQLMWINIVLATFNLLPAFPLDGGRAFRALLSLWTSRERATAIAAGTGQVFAIVLGVFGLFYNPWLALIALLIWFGARHEHALSRLRTTLAGVPASAAMLRRVDHVDPREPLGDAASLMVGSGGALPIVDHGTTVGVLTAADLAQGLEVAGPGAPVGRVPHHTALTVRPGEPLDRVLDKLMSAPDAIAVVIDEDAPVGVVTPEQLASYAALHPHA